MQKSDKKLIFLRGLPGSGKSTLASLFGDAVVREADQYYIDPETGEYQFDSKKIKNAHAWCKEKVLEDMKNSIETIIVSNTSTQEWEMAPYIQMAKENGYKVISLIVENRHGGVNIHDVPEDVLTKMMERFEVKL